MMFALFAVLTSLSTEELRKEFPYSPWDAAIVEDAIGRAVKESGGSAEVMTKNLIPIVVYFAEKRCVVLWRRLPTTADNKVYCYKKDSDDIVKDK